MSRERWRDSHGSSEGDPSSLHARVLATGDGRPAGSAQGPQLATVLLEPPADASGSSTTLSLESGLSCGARRVSSLEHARGNSRTGCGLARPPVGSPSQHLHSTVEAGVWGHFTTHCKSRNPGQPSPPAALESREGSPGPTVTQRSGRLLAGAATECGRRGQSGDT